VNTNWTLQSHRAIVLVVTALSTTVMAACEICFK